MLVFIISLLVFIPGLIILIVDWVRDELIESIGRAIACMFLLVFGGTGLLFTAIAAISYNNPQTITNLRIEYAKDVETLNATYNNIMSYTDDKARAIAATEYNQDVREFQATILKHQSELNNPWINWFIPYVYKEFDANAVQIIKYIPLGD